MVSLSEVEKREFINYPLSKADESLDDVEFLLNNNKLFLAENRIYFTIFYLVSALPLKSDFVTSKHRQLMGWFNKEFVKTGRVPLNTAAIYKIAYRNRTKADYEYNTIFYMEDTLRHL